jgi:thiamine biosynthesis lipoprotein
VELFQHHFKAMGSPCSLHFYCSDEIEFERVVELCRNQLEHLEAKYSRYRQDSMVSLINEAAGSARCFSLDDEFWRLLQYANVAYQISDGLFDVTSGILRQVWDFKASVIPEQRLIDKTLDKIGWHSVQLNQTAFQLPNLGMELDLGGIVKEYAADVLNLLAKHNNIAHGLIDLAGDIAVIGPHPDGTPWRVAIKNPMAPNSAIAHISLVSGGLASSGDYERCLVLDHKKYSHILNPKTGWPVQGYAAVSVWAEQCVVAGTLATTAMLREQQGLAFLRENGAEFVVVDQQGSVFRQ